MSEQQAPPEAPPPARFEDFMSDQIRTSLKENPNMPSLNKDMPPGSQPPRPQVQDPGHDDRRPADRPEVNLPETTPEQAAKALLPDFSKLAFGQPIEKVSEDARRVTPETPAPKAPEAPEEFPTDFPGSATPQAQATWAKMRTSVQTLWKQNADITGKLKDAEAKLREFDGKTPMANDEFERLTTERDTLAKELKLTKLEATPEYQRAVAKPMQVVDDEIKRLATKYNVRVGQIREALVEPDRDKQADLLSRVADTFNDRDKIGLFKLSDDAREVLRRRNVLQQDVKQALDYIEAKRNADAEKAKAEKAVEWNGAQKQAWKQISNDVYLARPIEGNDAWNQSLNQTRELVANTDFNSLSQVDQAKVLVQAAVLPRALAVIHQLWNMYQTAASSLKRYQGVTPGAGGGAASGGETNGAAVPVGSEYSFIDAVEQKIRGVRH
jgi:hypothetical protein